MRRAFAHGRFFHDESVDAQIGVVLRVGDRALQRFADHNGRFLRAERNEIERCRNRQALNGAGDFARFERRNLRVTICRANLHLL